MFCNHLVCFLLFFYGGTNSNILFSMCLFLSYLFLFIWTFCLFWKNLAFFCSWYGGTNSLHLHDEYALSAQTRMMSRNCICKKCALQLEKFNSISTFGLRICKLWINLNPTVTFSGQSYIGQKIAALLAVLFGWQNKIHRETLWF